MDIEHYAVNKYFKAERNMAITDNFQSESSELKYNLYMVTILC